MKSIKNISLSLLTLGAVSLAAITPASASSLIWNWDGIGADPNGAGNPLSIQASFDPTTDIFSWTVTFDQLTDGFTLAVSPGPNPKGADDLAILYVNKYEEAAAFVYNGKNDSTSHLNHPSGAGGGPIPLENNLDTTWLNNISVSNVGDVRTYDIEIDATQINMFGDTVNPPLNDWTGIAFGQEIGVWFHWWDQAVVKFDDTTGTPDAWWGEALPCGDCDPRQGWLDISHQPIPEPNSALLIGIATSLILVRRRFRSRL